MKTKPMKKPTAIDQRLQNFLNQIVLRNLKRLDLTPDQRAMVVSILRATKGKKK
jgi:hypothetical protein